MVLRKGKFGRFLACNKYPDCSNTLKLPVKGKLTSVDDDEMEEGKFYVNIQLPRKNPQKVDLLEVGKIDEDRKPVKGEGDLCAKCGKGHMVYRKGVYGAFLGCDNYPKCKTIVQIPIDENEITKDEKKKDE